MKFKIGDKVKIVKDETFFSPEFIRFNVHKTVEITQVNDINYVIKDSRGYCQVAYDDHLELFQETKTPTSLDDALGMVKETPTLGGIKHDEGKPDYSLLPLIATEEVVKVWTFGKKKYAAWNWTTGFVWSRPLAAAIRHIFAWASGQSKDPETGLSHLAHAICCLTMLLEFEATGTGQDDRRKTYKEEGK